MLTNEILRYYLIPVDWWCIFYMISKKYLWFFSQTIHFNGYNLLLIIFRFKQFPLYFLPWISNIPHPLIEILIKQLNKNSMFYAIKKKSLWLKCFDKDIIDENIKTKKWESFIFEGERKFTWYWFSNHNVKCFKRSNVIIFMTIIIR